MSSVLCIPCFNEAARLDFDELRPLLERADLRLLFIDDGSTDGTGAQLDLIRERSKHRIEVLSLPNNVGKGEAVRAGMRAALGHQPRAIGYADADLATPCAEILRLLDTLIESDADAVLGSRVRLLGRTIERGAVRHYLGRIFATAASITLQQPVYDTQCGAKWFRPGPPLVSALAEPFRSRWAFDVELLGRLFAEQARVVEVPLAEWIDQKDSKVGPGDALKMGLDLLRIRRSLRAKSGSRRER